MTEILLTAAACVGWLALTLTIGILFVTACNTQFTEVAVLSGLGVLSALLAAAAIVVRIVTNGVL